MNSNGFTSSLAPAPNGFSPNTTPNQPKGTTNPLPFTFNPQRPQSTITPVSDVNSTLIGPTGFNTPTSALQAPIKSTYFITDTRILNSSLIFSF